MTLFGPQKIAKCLKNGPFSNQKCVKNGSKTCFPKNDLGPFGVLNRDNSVHFGRSVCPTCSLCAPCTRPAHYFYSDFPRFSPQVHHYPVKPWDGECDDNCVGERRKTGLPSTRGSKGTFGEMSIEGMVVETRDWGYQRRWSPWGIGIDGLHTTLIILQLHMPIVQKANHLCGYPKPCRPGVEHCVPNAQLHNK